MTKKKQGKKQGMTIQEATEMRSNPAPSKDVQAHTPENRPPRRPLSAVKRLEVPHGIMEEGYEYRWILDRAERIQMFEGAWWDQVKDGNGEPIRKHSGRPDRDEYLLLYRTRSEWFAEDVAENRKKPINLVRDKAKLDAPNQHSSEYVPEGHEAVVTINNPVPNS